MATCNTNSLLENSACFNCYTTSGFFLPLKLALLSQILEAKSGLPAPSVDELVANTSCFACLSAGDIQLLKIQLLCNLLGGNVAYSGSDSSGPYVNTGDPLFNYPGVPGGPTFVPTPYELDVTPGPILTWTFPYFPNAVGAGPGQQAVLPLLAPVIGLFLQRSQNSTSTPNGTNSFYQVFSNVPVPDPDWTTIHTWTYATFAAAYFDLIPPNDGDQTFSFPYSDAGSWPPSSYYSYRLIMILGPVAGKTYELDWNVATIVPEYFAKAENDSVTKLTKITWSDPVFT